MAVALYARVSTTKQAEKDLSIPDQLRQMREWCKRQGLAVATEYVEPGASATDDRRPVFQQMIAEATLSPSPFDAIIVHSRSRFFRDLFQFLSYERTLKKAGVRVISITQQTSDDPAGEMASKIFSLFDEYQSRENGKHTLRAMKENARQGYFNGSRSPYGYRTVEVEAKGRRGRKKRLEIDPGEAAVVRQIFALYLNGHKGEELGSKAIAVHLSGRGVTLRGRLWTHTRVHAILSNELYCGTYWFNKYAKDGSLNNESERIRLIVEPIVDATTFERARARRASRAPDRVPPRVVNSPTLLTGLLKCGHCGAGMTVATGKGGRYRYYKCHTRIAKGNDRCKSPNVPMEKLDRAVLDALADKVFTPGRVVSMLDALRRRVREGRNEQDAHLRHLTKELNELQRGSERLFEAVEKGLLPMDAALQERAHRVQARRQALLVEIAGLRREEAIPAKLFVRSQAEPFTKALRTKLSQGGGFAKQYLRLLVSEVRLATSGVELRGSYRALSQAVAGMKMGTQIGVPTFVPDWLPE